MSPIELAYFGIPTLLAFALLINWKWRRGDVARRVNRGLRGYLYGSSLALPEEGDDTEEELIVA